MDWSAFLQSGSLIRIDQDRYLVGWGERIWQEKIENPFATYFYFPDFFLQNPTHWFQHKNVEILSFQELISYLPPSTRLELSWENSYFNHFEKAFYDLKDTFSQGLLKKAVPYVFEKTYTQINQTHLLSALARIIPFTYSHPLHLYGYWDKSHGILGATPEILFKYKKDQTGILETVACAGTKRSSQSEEDFLRDAKEAVEHQLVVEGICASLSAMGPVEVGERTVLKLSKLSHLVTPIQMKIEHQLNFLAIVQALHPTPALGAFPKDSGLKWLRAYQQEIPRERYGAPAGYILEGGREAKCLVAIRNMQWNAEGAKIGAGCGVVAESQLHHEWQEICLKISSIRELIWL